MLTMYTRSLTLPEDSFFLFGPRGVGKSTWLKQTLPDAKWFNLLHNKTLLTLMRDPAQLQLEVESLASGSWIVIDEIQKLPELLNEVHSIIFENEDKYKFALTGSSARKLRRLNTNLLAGRAIMRKFFPLTGDELNYEFEIDTILKFGTLPRIVSKPKSAIDILEAYVGTYIKEEIQQEALVENIASFSRFLEVASIMNGQVMNVAGLARDVAVARPTVQRYFDILVDTLIGFTLPAWQPKARVKESAHPKFYFFDTGVVRALQGKLREPIEAAEKGALLETLVLHELRSWINRSNCGGELSYWNVTSGGEIDFVWRRGHQSVGIEVKSSESWRRDSGKLLQEFIAESRLTKAYGIYLGEKILKDNNMLILPIKDFMKKLSSGEILS